MQSFLCILVNVDHSLLFTIITVTIASNQQFSATTTPILISTTNSGIEQQRTDRK